MHPGPGLTGRQRMFVNEFMRDYNLTRALHAIGERAFVAAKVMALPHVAAEIERRHAARVAEQQKECKAEDVMERLCLIAFADPTELVEHRRIACPDCWCGLASDDHDRIDPDCPRCRGDGESYVVIKDTRYLSRAGRALYAGLKINQTTGSIEVVLQKQLHALELLGRVFGIFEADNRQKADGLKQLLDYVASNGQSLPVAEEVPYNELMQPASQASPPSPPPPPPPLSP